MSHAPLDFRIIPAYQQTHGRPAQQPAAGRPLDSQAAALFAAEQADLFKLAREARDPLVGPPCTVHNILSSVRREHMHTETERGTEKLREKRERGGGGGELGAQAQPPAAGRPLDSQAAALFAAEQADLFELAREARDPLVSPPCTFHDNLSSARREHMHTVTETGREKLRAKEREEGGGGGVRRTGAVACRRPPAGQPGCRAVCC
jgi:hypothetical protein